MKRHLIGNLSLLVFIWIGLQLSVGSIKHDHASASTPLPPPTFDRLWGGLVTPIEVVADHQGNVYVVNGDAPIVERFDDQGVANGWQVNVAATGIAVDAVGHVYLTLDSKVQKYDATGRFIKEWGELGTGPGQFGPSPGRVALNANNILHVLDPDNHRIQQFDTDGNLAGMIGAPPGVDPFRPVDLDFENDGTIFLLNRLGYDETCNLAVTEILRLSPAGELQTRWGGWSAIGDGPGEVANVVGLAVSDGTVYITDYRYGDCHLDATIHRMQAFDRDGGFLVEWGRQGDAPGQFSEHLGADVDPSGEWLYVADSFNNRIQQFRIQHYDPACEADAINPLVNRDFECGTAPWRFFSNGQGRYTTTPASYNGAWGGDIQIVRPGTNVQLYQKDIALEPDQHYRLYFAAKSSNGRDLKVFLHKHGSPYTNYGLNGERFDLTNDWQSFEVEFSTSNFSQPVDDARLRFWLAPYDVTGMRYHIDYVFLEKITNGTPPIPPPVPIDPRVPPKGYCEATPGNVLANSGIEWHYPWLFYTDQEGTSDLDADAYECDRSGHITIQKQGNNVQLYQKDLTLLPDTTYRLRFAAKSTAGRDVRVFLHKHGAPYTNYGLNGIDLDLTSDWQVYQMQFTTLGFASPVDDARLRFWLAHDDVNGEQYWFDDVVLVPVDGVEAAALVISERTDNRVPLHEVGEFIDDDEETRLAGGVVGVEPRRINRALRVMQRSVDMDAMPLPDAPFGTATLSVAFRNRTQTGLSDIVFKVRRLKGDHLLLNADGGPGAVGATVSVPAEALGEYGVLAPGEEFTVDFVVGLQRRGQVKLKLDAFGIPVDGPEPVVIASQEEPGFEFELQGEDASPDLYLPLVAELDAR